MGVEKCLHVCVRVCIACVCGCVGMDVCVYGCVCVCVPMCFKWLLILLPEAHADPASSSGFYPMKASSQVPMWQPHWASAASLGWAGIGAAAQHPGLLAVLGTCMWVSPGSLCVPCEENLV